MVRSSSNQTRKSNTRQNRPEGNQAYAEYQACPNGNDEQDQLFVSG
jgi:hypothetical protein